MQYSKPKVIQIVTVIPDPNCREVDVSRPQTGGISAVAPCPGRHAKSAGAGSRGTFGLPQGFEDRFESLSKKKELRALKSRDSFEKRVFLL
jgi:hypothetical protein